MLREVPGRASSGVNCNGLMFQRLSLNREDTSHSDTDEKEMRMGIDGLWVDFLIHPHVIFSIVILKWERLLLR